MDWKYLSQTPPNDNGDYTMTWKDKNDENRTIITKHNIFKHLYDRDVQDDVDESTVATIL